MPYNIFPLQFNRKLSLSIGNTETESEVTQVTFNFSKEYKIFLGELKDKIRGGRLKAALAVNREVIELYWQIGNQILNKQEEAAWGSKLVDVLSQDLQNAFPETHGFSVRNLKYMRQFAQTYPSCVIGQQIVAQLPWGHIIFLIQMVKDNVARTWYAEQAVDQGWSRPVFEKNIKGDLFGRQAISTTKTSNYLERLPSSCSGLAQELLKQPYSFDFLGLHDEADEREIEHASIQHITKFMLELGKGFASVGSQVPITIDDEVFFIDMLFYNLRLRCYTVIEFKATKFKPEHAGQLNFYLSAVDDLMRHPNDNPSVGLLLCKARNKVVAEYALTDLQKSIGISEYELTRAIPENLKSNLPSIEEIEAELNEFEINTLIKETT
jgi:predicted nuclease of restriction endonuclease-like (RecB) superfamily